MPSSLEAAGATREPSEYAALSMDRHITGLWTQRSPLRDADVPYLQGKFYSASRFDSLIDGINREMTARLTNARRKGISPWNINTFPPLNSFYAFRYIQSSKETISVIVDGQDGVIYDASNGGKVALFTKSATAGPARFCTAGTTMFIGDGGQGVDQMMYVQSSFIWAASTAFSLGQYIVDSNLNIQAVTTAGTSGAGPTPPAWSSTPGATTTDNGVTWTNKGPAVQFWGVPAPTVAPTVANAQLSQTTYGSWAASTYYSTGTISIVDTNNNVQVLTTPGTTGGSQPSWNATVGGTTTDGSAVWTNKGTINWQASHTYAVGDSIKVTWTQVIYLGIVHNEQQYTTISRTSIFKCITPGVSGAAQPTQEAPDGSTEKAWAYPAPLTTTDHTVIWQNVGNSALTWTSIGASTAMVTALTILDSNGNLQNVVAPGKSGSAAPTWATASGAQTTDGTVVWQNAGHLAGGNTAAWTYYFAYRSSVTGAESNCSPASVPIILAPSSYIAVQGPGTANVWADQVRIYRTAAGQPTPLLVATIANPGAVSWNFADTTPDTSLNTEIQGAIQLENSLPPGGMTAPVLHLGRIFGILNNTVVWSGGPDTLNGNGFCSFPPLNYLPAQEQLVRLKSVTLGSGAALLVFGTRNVYVILGDGTLSNLFRISTYMESVGILSYDALAAAGSTLYLFTTKNKFVSLDPSAGYIEAGFPIGDQFTNVTTGGINQALYSPSTAQVTWHEESSGDTAIYVSDGAVGWFRLSPVASPESGYMWSPRAAIVGGCSAVQSIEVLPGVSKLLIGPPSGGGAISFRDPNVNADWTSSGTNLVTNPGFDSNIVGTPNGVPLAQGAACTDGWTVAILTNPTQLQVMLDSGSFDSPPNCLLIRVPAGTINSAGVPGARVFWTPEPCTPGQVIRYGAQMRWDASGYTPPPGVLIVQRIGLWFTDASGNLVQEVYRETRNAISPVWNILQDVAVAPAGATQVYLQCAAFIVTGSGAIGGLCADMRWDDAFLRVETYQSFPAWDVKGNITLCESGQVAEIAHIALKSVAVGSRPKVSILLGEIAATTDTPFEELAIESEDPPILPPSETMYSDRYPALQNGVCPKCDNFQLKIDYGAQNVQDELLKFSVYGAVHNERRQQ